MIIDLIRLENDIVKFVDIDYNYSFDKEMLKGTDILSLDNVSIKGKIFKNSLDEFDINLIIDGIAVLPCAITLDPVDYKIHIEINDNLEKIMEEIDENHKKIHNSIDILPIIWENILMELPMKVVSDNVGDVKLSGDGWKLVTDLESHEKLNPELAKLQDLLKEKEV